MVHPKEATAQAVIFNTQSHNQISPNNHAGEQFPHLICDLFIYFIYIPHFFSVSTQLTVLWFALLHFIITTTGKVVLAKIQTRPWSLSELLWKNGDWNLDHPTL